MTIPTVPLRVAPPLLFGSRRSLRLIDQASAVLGDTARLPCDADGRPL